MVFDDKILAERISFETGRGYWSVGGKMFFNKAQCLKYASRIKNENVAFHFLDPVYRTLDWTKEPSEDISVLYRTRAEQIRSSYDYVVLFFSGGADSRNILDTFLDNNLHIDEIVSFYPVNIVEKSLNTFSVLDKKSENLMFEYTMAAEPKLREVEKRSPKTKITVVDYTDFTVNFILNGKMNKVFQGGIAADPFHVGHYYYAEQLRKVSETKNVCAVTGFDKPRMIYDMLTDKFGLVFHDFLNIFGNFSIDSLDGYLPKIEHFYFTPSMPTITQKQCFDLAKRLRASRMLNVENSKHVLIRCRENRFLIYDPHTDFFKSVIYPKWTPDLWQADKDTVNYFFQSQTNWFHSTEYTDKRARDYYKGQVDELVSGVDECYLERNNGRVCKFKDYMTAPIWFR